MKTKNPKWFSALVILFLLASTAVYAATPQQISDSIEAGIEWLVAQQDPNGFWFQLNAGGETGLALVKLQERAFFVGIFVTIRSELSLQGSC